MASWAVASDEAAVERYFARLALPVRLVAKELDALARAALPGCVVGIKWSVPFYALKGPVCYVSAAKKHVTFGILKGADIADASGRLVGTGKSPIGKAVFPTGEPVPRALVRAWIREARRLDATWGKDLEEWTCPKCGRTFRAKNARHSCTSQAPEKLLAPYPHALPLYERVRDIIRRFGDVEVEATRTQVAFRAKKRFAFLWIPAMSLDRGAPDLYLSIALDHRIDSPRIKEIVEPRRGVHMHHMLLARKSDLDAQVRGWLREAYERASE